MEKEERREAKDVKKGRKERDILWKYRKDETRLITEASPFEVLAGFVRRLATAPKLSTNTLKIYEF